MKRFLTNLVRSLTKRHKSSAKRLPRTQLLVEPLEDRQVPSATGLNPYGVTTVTLNSYGTLVIEGSAASDRALVFEQSYYDVRLGLLKTDIVVQYGELNGSLSYARYWKRDVSRIVFNGRDGDDLFENGTDRPCVAYGGEGHDLLAGGRGRDILHGEGGRDALFGSVELIPPSHWNLTTLIDPTYIDPAPPPSHQPDEFYGGPGSDGITGSGWLDGGSGDDELIVVSNAGGNMLLGGEGTDKLHAGQLGDYLHGGAGNDKLYGGVGDDRLYGDDGSDFLWGYAGNDYLDPGLDDAVDQMFGGYGKDAFVSWGSLITDYFGDFSSLVMATTSCGRTRRAAAAAAASGQASGASLLRFRVAELARVQVGPGATARTTSIRGVITTPISSTAGRTPIPSCATSSTTRGCPWFLTTRLPISRRTKATVSWGRCWTGATTTPVTTWPPVPFGPADCPTHAGAPRPPSGGGPLVAR